jgi:hypothetical protein
MAGQYGSTRAAGQVPQPDGVVYRPAGQQQTVRRGRNTRDKLGVAGQSVMQHTRGWQGPTVEQCCQSC